MSTVSVPNIAHSYIQYTQTILTYIADTCGPVRCSQGRDGHVLVAGFHRSISAGLLQEEPGSLLQLLLT